MTIPILDWLERVSESMQNSLQNFLLFSNKFLRVPSAEKYTLIKLNERKISLGQVTDYSSVFSSWLHGFPSATTVFIKSGNSSPLASVDYYSYLLFQISTSCCSSDYLSILGSFQYKSVQTVTSL